MKQDFENVFPHELTTSDYKGQLEYYKAHAFERFWKKFGKGVQDKTIFAKNFFCNNFNKGSSVETGLKIIMSKYLLLCFEIKFNNALLFPLPVPPIIPIIE